MADVAADAVGVELNITAIQNEGRGSRRCIRVRRRRRRVVVELCAGGEHCERDDGGAEWQGEVCVFSNVTAHYALDVLAYITA